MTVSILSSVTGCAHGQAAFDDPSDTTNWGSARAGARFTAGEHTQFLPPNDLTSFATGGGLIFRHGPRGLEKVIVVELPSPVVVRSVVLYTAYEDVVRVPVGFDVSLSMDGQPDSYTLAGSTDDIHANRTMVAIETPAVARFVRLSFRDSGGGSRVSEIGVYSAKPDAVMASLDGFTYEYGQGWLTLDEIAKMRKQFGSRGDADLTFVCGGVEYSAPAPPGDGTILSRYLKERGIMWRTYSTTPKVLPYYRALGCSGIEMYVRWNLIEEKEGVFDFSLYDAFHDFFRRNDLRWSPMIIAGPAYTLPEWFRKSKDYVPYRCLEHDRDNAVASLWNPKLRYYIDRFMGEFVKHYSKAGDPDWTLMLGVSGIFGENLYPHESDRDWTTSATGDYHSHSGWWAGDPYARVSFRAYMTHRYKSIEFLNAAWKTDYASFEQMQPIAPQQCRTPRARYDFMCWYNDSMTDFTEFWLKTARKHKPNGKIQLGIGGEGRPSVGTDYGCNAKLAAKYKIGIRITNESPDYALNVAMTRWINTGTRLYGTWIGMEPASLQIEPGSIAERVFNVRTSGASELYCYQPALSSKDSYTKLLQNVPYLRQDKPTVSVAYWIPRSHMLALGEVDYVGPMMALRTATDFDAVDDTMIKDGALDRYQVLVMGTGYMEDEKVLARIARWVESRGVIVRTNAQPLTTIDGSTDYQPRLFGPAQAADSASWSQANRVGKGFTLLVPDGGRSREQLARLLSRLLQEIGDLGPQYIPPARVIGEGKVFGSQMQKDYLILNSNPSPVTVKYDIPRTGGKRQTGTTMIPGHSIRAVQLER